MKIILSDVVVNQVTSREGEKKDKQGNKTGEHVTYRNVALFVPADPNDPYGQAKAITANPAETSEGIAAFKILQSKEGQKVSLLGEYEPSKTVKGNLFPEKFRILAVVESVKFVEVKLLKAAA